MTDQEKIECSFDLYNGDCLTEMEKIADESVDLIFNDLPYGQVSCDWDKKIDLKKMWEHFMRGSELTVLVTDSSPANVILTKDIIERHLNNSAAKIIAIANKHDLKGRMKPDEIEAALGVPTFGMVGIESTNEKKLKKIIEKSL